MGRKNTIRCTEIVRKPLIPLRTYAVYLKGSSEPIIVAANKIQENDSTLEFRIVFEGNSRREESEEIVAIFSEWSYATTSFSDLRK